MKTMVTTAAVALVALTLAACGGGGDGDADPTTTTTTIAATTTTTVATTTTAPATTTTAATTDSTAPAADPLEIKVVADNVAFDVETITVRAGQELTVVFDNRDSTSDEGHNIHFLVGEQDYATPIENAPSIDEVTFTVDEPGEYVFICDTHTVEMVGTLVVEP